MGLRARSNATGLRAPSEQPRAEARGPPGPRAKATAGPGQRFQRPGAGQRRSAPSGTDRHKAMRTDATPGLNLTRQPGAKGLLGAPQQGAGATAARPPPRGQLQRRGPRKHPPKGCRKADRRASPCPSGKGEMPTRTGRTAPLGARNNRPSEGKGSRNAPTHGDGPLREARFKVPPPSGGGTYGKRPLREAQPRDGAHRERDPSRRATHPRVGGPVGTISRPARGQRRPNRVSSENRKGLPGRHPRMPTRATGPRGVGTLQGTGKTRRTQRSRPRATSEHTGTGGPFGTFRRAGRNPAKALRGHGQDQARTGNPAKPSGSASEPETPQRAPARSSDRNGASPSTDPRGQRADARRSSDRRAEARQPREQRADARRSSDRQAKARRSRDDGRNARQSSERRAQAGGIDEPEAHGSIGRPGGGNAGGSATDSAVEQNPEVERRPKGRGSSVATRAGRIQTTGATARGDRSVATRAGLPRRGTLRRV